MNRKYVCWSRAVALATGIVLGAAVQANCPVATGFQVTTPDSAFADLGGGMVQHVTTGLIWKRCAEGQVWDGATCTGSPAGYTWADVFNQVDAVNANAAGTQNLGFNAWRVPNVNELGSIVEHACTAAPLINTTQFLATDPALLANIFWTSSPFVGIPSLAWAVNFLAGPDDYLPRVDSYMLRLVRGGDAPTKFNGALPYTVTPNAGAGGSFTSNLVQTVAAGGTASLTVVPNPGYRVTAVTADTCGPMTASAGGTYTTAAVNSNCIVTASFAPIVAATPVPTLSGWMTLVLGGILLLIGLGRLPRQY